MGRFTNKLTDSNNTIKVLIGSNLLAVFFAIFMGIGWMRAPENITVNIPPDLSNGAQMKPGQTGKPGVYAFTHYIFQQLNRWPKNGNDDYYTQIHALKNYLTPRCFDDRISDYNKRKGRNELSRRERAVWEIPGRGYENRRVAVESDSSWVVSLDLHLQESMRGEPIKDRFINYPLRVVKYPVDLERNAFQLALDCYAGMPTNIEIAGLENEVLE